MKLAYREPFAWTELLGFLRARAIPGVEELDGGTWSRVIGTEIVRVERRGGALEASADLPGLRAVFDLDADPKAIAKVLKRDPLLAPLVRRTPGLRVPGTIDPFEMTIRAILGQQITVRGATTLAGRLVARFGTKLRAPKGSLTHRFPAAAELANVGLEEIAALGMPKKRAETIAAAARAFASQAITLDNDFAEALDALPGVGPWTAHYLAMRALHAPDVFLASDLGIKKALGGLAPKEAEKRSAPWRPYRAYAVMYLWSSLG